jgi:hypothetical protein
VRRIAPLVTLIALLAACIALALALALRPATSAVAPARGTPFPTSVLPTPLVITGDRTAPLGAGCPASHQVKGDARGMVYHAPGGASYARTMPDECFATEGAAREAGYRPAQR